MVEAEASNYDGWAGLGPRMNEDSEAIEVHSPVEAGSDPETQTGTSSVAIPGHAGELGSNPNAATELDLKAHQPALRDRSTLRQVTLTTSEEHGAESSARRDPDRKASDYIGYIIDGRYHVLSIIAHGGMGVVYRCRHRTLDKLVAVKILRPDLAGDRDVTERFLMEAKAASSIGNRHIIDVTDFGELPDGETYLVMEYLEGLALSKRLREERALQTADIVNIGKQIAQGLHAAHEAGIVHRDLKPDNIFLLHEPDGSTFVKILDFGIAKVASSQNKVTRDGKIFGTPHYMAPEQGSGGSVDRRTDVYSLGVMLYELGCGLVPFDAENPLGILTQHMYVAPLPPNERSDAVQQIPVALEAVILKCLSKDPTQRYGSMQDLCDDLVCIEQSTLPRAVRELVSRGTDELPLGRLKAAASGVPAELSPSRGNSLLAFSLSALLVAVLGTALFFPDNAGNAVAIATPSARSVSAAVDAGLRKRKKTHTVALVLSPIDARVFDGSRDLGTMPISIKLEEGHQATLDVKRDGFLSERVIVDGTSSKLIVELEPIPGATPDVPVPAAHVDDAGSRGRVIHIDGPRVTLDGVLEPVSSAPVQPDGGSAPIPPLNQAASTWGEGKAPVSAGAESEHSPQDTHKPSPVPPPPPEDPAISPNGTSPVPQGGTPTPLPESPPVGQ